MCRLAHYIAGETLELASTIIEESEYSQAHSVAIGSPIFAC